MRFGKPQLTNQWALPDAGEQCFEPSEIPGSKLVAPFALKITEYVMDLCVCCVSALGKADNSRTALVGCVVPDDVAEIFQASEQSVHRLLAHAGALGKRAWSSAIRTRKLKHRHMRH